MKITEDRLQAECFKWFWNTYPELRRTLFHVPNGDNKNAISGARYKALGVVAGVPDLIWMINGTAICFELKTDVGVISEKQKAVHSKFKEQGITTYIIRDIETFRAIIEKEIVKKGEEYIEFEISKY